MNFTLRTTSDLSKWSSTGEQNRTEKEMRNKVSENSFCVKKNNLGQPAVKKGGRTGSKLSRMWAEGVYFRLRDLQSDCKWNLEKEWRTELVTEDAAWEHLTLEGLAFGGRKDNLFIGEKKKYVCGSKRWEHAWLLAKISCRFGSDTVFLFCNKPTNH